MFVVVRRLLRWSLLGLLFLGAPALAAIRVQPMAYDLTPTGSGAMHDIRVENTGASPVPVELRVERRHILPDGTEKREAAEDDFLIFPPQGIVPANGFQTFRVQYIGPAIDHSVLYVITVAQLPVDLQENADTGVQFLFNLGTLAAVSPDRATANVVVTDVQPAAEADQLTITVRNDGNRYTRLRTGKWIFTAPDGKEATLEGEDLAKAMQQPLIEPGTTRIVTLPVPAGFVREGARVKFDPADPAR